MKKQWYIFLQVFIQDAKKYRENRTQCRKDIQAFQDKVYEVEDQLATELTKEKLEESDELSQ